MADTGHAGEIAALWQPDEWVCSHYQRSHFGPDDLDVFEHLGHCYVDSPGYFDLEPASTNGGREAVDATQPAPPREHRP